MLAKAQRSCILNNPVVTMDAHRPADEDKFTAPAGAGYRDVRSPQQMFSTTRAARRAGGVDCDVCSLEGPASAMKTLEYGRRGSTLDEGIASSDLLATVGGCVAWRAFFVAVLVGLLVSFAL